MVNLLDRTLVERRVRTRYLGRNLLYLQKTSSTQDVARAEAERGGPVGTAVLAEEQTAGRGRLGRPWVSPAGKNIYVTLLMRPPTPKLRVLSIVSPLAVAEALEGIRLAPPPPFSLHI